MSDVTLHVNMVHLTVDDRLLIKTSRTARIPILGLAMILYYIFLVLIS